MPTFPDPTPGRIRIITWTTEPDGRDSIFQIWEFDLAINKDGRPASPFNWAMMDALGHLGAGRACRISIEPVPTEN